MLFKTRVGLVELEGPLEFRVSAYLEDKTPSYSVWARPQKEQSFDYKGVFGRAKVSNTSVHLALFLVSDGTGAAIAQCMKLIEEAICSDAKICDLSAVGDPAAWSEKWTIVEWRP